MKTAIFLLAALLVFLSPSFADDTGSGDKQGDVISIAGRVEHFSYEGGFYGIKGEDGTEYKPLELDGSDQVEGLRVKVQARLIDRKLLTRGWGVPIEIMSIERDDTQ